MSQVPLKNHCYIYLVHGKIPGIVPRVLYRRSGRQKERIEGKKIIKCPFCTRRLTDIGLSVKVDLYRHPTRSKVDCHGYLKCSTCKNEVGVILV